MSNERHVKIFFHVQHLLGIGHLRRAAILARALAAAGFDVTLASGGMPVPDVVPANVKLVQLPPATAADASFKYLVDERGQRVDDEWKRRRQIGDIDGPRAGFNPEFGEHGFIQIRKDPEPARAAGFPHLGENQI